MLIGEIRLHLEKLSDCLSASLEKIYSKIAERFSAELLLKYVVSRLDVFPTNGWTYSLY